MWFNNAIVFQYELEEAADLNELLAHERLKPCPPHARSVTGWMPAFADELVMEIAGCALFCMGREERILPRGVINRLLAERIEALEAQQGRRVKRAEKAQMAEDLEFELLPKSFCVQKKMQAFLDTSAKRLVVNTASGKQASQLMALLRKTIPGIRFEPLHIPDTLAQRFAAWLNDPSTLPANFALAADCQLFALDNEKKRFSCKGCELPADEVLALLDKGLAASEVSLIWNERVQFSLTTDLTLKRLKCLDYLVDEFSEIRELEEEYLQRDAELALLSGELRSLVNALLAGLTDTATETAVPEEAVV
ncbi:recombination-associated protein RdgC [Legionella geestiana]|uniref:recombination-associated protein RdgC n=1 Tax=Legionella geestiana TaxID=45065 RepID=UPI001093038F|nr:recombination-associated protein RdgC [Legionella geestiana]QDQ40624.1 recombination-associated protein RdgC [Legionella geestiana]